MTDLDALKAWMNKGFLSDLFLAAPPKAPLAPTSRLTVDHLGKIPGKVTEDGWTGHYGWASHETTKDELRGQVKLLNGNRFSFGLATRTLHAFDVDTQDEDFARWAYKSILNNAPGITEEFGVRVGRYPSFLILFRPTSAMRKHRLAVVRDENKSAVELLAFGQFAVLHGDHPKTLAPYRWYRWGSVARFQDMAS